MICDEADGAQAAQDGGLRDWLPVVLTRLRSTQPEAYIGLLSAAVDSHDTRLRRGAAGTLARIDIAQQWNAVEATAARKLLRDVDESVRTAAINAVNAVLP